MRSSHQKDQLTAKKKSLSIHIDTSLIGPHGMPLIYGSTPNHIGSIRGTVRFSSNYDCKGRDIQIIYEAWSESRWTVMENKKMVQHHAKKVLGYQTWSFPLVHTKSHGSTVVRGNYEQDFEALFIKPSPSSSAHPSTSARTSCESTPSSSPTSSSVSAHSHSFNHLRTPLSSSSSASSIYSTTSTSSISSRTQPILPSSSTNPNCTVKYTIRAVLTRPFPSLSNVEASQEVWVVHSNSIAPPSNKCSAISPPHMESSPLEQQPTSTSDGGTTTSTTSPFMSTPASKIASDWSASLASRKVTPMPSTPYGRNQLVVFIYYFCTIVLGLGFCQRYSGVLAPSTASSTATGSSSL
ncbi:hypothetical protein BG015_008850 [Linnemannia schmuckeri]|uniref:Uncharacterized protein n=1 Tax=Linnemannia schmuckeri TaxID=64567 RepID=A0A9P5S8A0_9FUNG|nr:hypothetical protein BG015_008850 [Linnemannia schmuckeri]